MTDWFEAWFGEEIAAAPALHAHHDAWEAEQVCDTRPLHARDEIGCLPRTGACVQPGAGGGERVLVGCCP